MSTSATPAPLHDVIVALAYGRSLAQGEISAAFDVVMRGDASPVQISALLTGLRVRGETSDIIAGAARALRRAMVHLELPDPAGVVDTCGTGGGVIGTFNISTAAAFVAAGAGVRIAKHGNRSFTSRSGSADVLEALGVSIDVSVESMRRAFDAAGMVFMYAPRMHPAMRHVGPVRRELAVPTVMNVVGPLANPASAGRQVVGVADPARLAVIAEALGTLGTVHSLVVHGEPGMDEISPIGPTRVLEIRDGTIHEWQITPELIGTVGATAEELIGGSPGENAVLVERCLAGNAPPGAIGAVVANAGAAIYVSGLVPAYTDGVDAARAAIANGSAAAALARLRHALPRS